MKATTLTKEVLIEELVETYSFSVRYLMEKGIRCIMCGEPIWGTLEEAAKEKGFSDEQIAEIIEELNMLVLMNNEEGSDAVLVEIAKYKKP